MLCSNYVFGIWGRVISCVYELAKQWLLQLYDFLLKYIMLLKDIWLGFVYTLNYYTSNTGNWISNTSFSYHYKEMLKSQTSRSMDLKPVSLLSHQMPTAEIAVVSKINNIDITPYVRMLLDLSYRTHKISLQVVFPQIARTLRSMLIRYQSDTFTSDQYLINIDLMVFAV